MSIYSGFATRHQQQNYDQYVGDLLFVLQKRLIKFYENSQADEDKFFTIFSQLYNQISHLQKNKYLQPKSSIFVNQIYEYLKQKKQQRNLNPQQDLKKFQKSIALRSKKQQFIKMNQLKFNNLIERSSLSFGKIKRQIDHGKFQLNKTTSVTNRQEINNKSFEKQPINSQDKLHHKPKRLFSSNGIRPSNKGYQLINQNLNEAKIQYLQANPAQEIVKQYLQKTNKNYLRGYRKRKIMQEKRIPLQV